MPDEKDSKFNEVNGTPRCGNCHSKDLDKCYTEKGQYKGSWCTTCGSMNRPNGLAVVPKQKLA